MMNSIVRMGLATLMLFQIDATAAAEQGYRYMHVTIDTPWTIFLFLLVIVLFPFVLMAILYWYFAIKSDDKKTEKNLEANAESEAGEQ